jgi:hypothetical protein
VAAHWRYDVSITITPGNHLRLRDALNAALVELKAQSLIEQAVWQLTEQSEEDDELLETCSTTVE